MLGKKLIKLNILGFNLEVLFLKLSLPHGVYCCALSGVISTTLSLLISVIIILEGVLGTETSDTLLSDDAKLEVDIEALGFKLDKLGVELVAWGFKLLELSKATDVKGVCLLKPKGLVESVGALKIRLNTEFELDLITLGLVSGVGRPLLTGVKGLVISLATDVTDATVVLGNTVASDAGLLNLLQNLLLELLKSLLLKLKVH